MSFPPTSYRQFRFVIATVLSAWIILSAAAGLAVEITGEARGALVLR
jgi:hypothetical protein